MSAWTSQRKKPRSRFARAEGHRSKSPAQSAIRECVVRVQLLHNRRPHAIICTALLHLPARGAAASERFAFVPASRRRPARSSPAARAHSDPPMTSREAVPTSAQANAIRALAMDAVEAAKSGHPGMPMGMAEIAVALWQRHLRHSPAQSALARSRPLRRVERPRLDAAVRVAASDRLRPADRRDPKRFRQLHSKTPGHPEFGMTPGVETTTGPLGQGLANAVGMALAERLARRGVQPPRPRDRRSPHLRVRRRRLPDGRHLARGLLARRHARPGQADRRLRRQRHLDRRARARLVHRRHAAALRGLRLERDPRRRRPRRRRGRRRAAGGEARRRPAHADLLQDHDRAKARRPRPAPPTPTVPRSGRRRSRPRAPRSRWPHAPFVDSAGHLRGVGRARARRRAAERVVGALRALSRRASRARRRVHPAHGGRAAGDVGAGERGLRRRAGREGRDHRHAQGLAAGDRGARAAAAGAGRRLRRPHRIGVHQLVGSVAGLARAPGQLRQLRRARVRDERHRQRHDARTAAAFPTSAPSSRSPTTRATRCAWPR